MGLQRRSAPLDLWRLFLATKLWGRVRTLAARPLWHKAKRAGTTEPGFAARVQGRMHHEGASGFRRNVFARDARFATS